VKAEASIVGVGARSAIGLDALQTTLAVRANKTVIRASHMIDRHGEPIGTARLACIDDAVQRLPRYIALAAPPLVQATFAWRHQYASRGEAAPPLPVVVALPPPSRPGFDARLHKELLPWLQQQSGITLDARSSMTVFEDRGGGVRAFSRALDLLDDGCEVVAVGGIDSYFDADALEGLDAAFRLHGHESENGFVPGEGAAFLLLSRRTAGLPRLASVLGAAVEDEPRPFGSEEPCQAMGMTHALRRAAGSLHDARCIAWVLTDVANERHRVQEWQMAIGRCTRTFAHEVEHDQPLLRTGDVGAASAAMLAAMACVSFTIGTARADMVMIATHSDASERGALLLSRGEA
jgi:3-oxoacyl-[acyl-carrier-protein] synthase I